MIKKTLKEMPGYRAARSLLGQLGVARYRVPKAVVVPMDQLLCGGENGLSAAQYARHTGNLLLPSTPFSRSPYVQFLEQYLQMGDEIFRPDVFRKTSYFTNAAGCINMLGSYKECHREDGLEKLARNFVGQFKNCRPQGDDVTAGPDTSALDSSLCVRPVRYSDCYELIEGAHDAAAAYVQGRKTYSAYLTPESAVTPLQQLLLDHAFTGDGRPRLYQPIDSPEVEKWQLIRRCSDRVEAMSRFLRDHALLPPPRIGYLDIACNYGWFVKEFERLGFRASGVEMDWAAVELGKLVYGLKPDQIIRSEAVRFLRDHSERYDITSCFSLLHHFVLGRASISAEEMLRLIDDRTKEVFFFDMGQNHEEWFCESLKEWDVDHIEQWVLDNSSFTKIYRLGKDSDSVEPYELNYGRTLFACMRRDPVKTVKD